MSNEKSQEQPLTAAMDASHPLWVPEWKEGAGEATIRRHPTHSTKDKSNSKVILYCSWFCPFAQRAWIAVEELGIPYEYVECNPYRVDPKEAGGYTKKSLSLLEKKALMPEFLKTSPRGLVPAIRNVDGGERVWESAVVVEYLDGVYGRGDSRLLTSSAEGQALVRIYVDHCTSRIQKAFYTFLMQQSAEGQATAKKDFYRECRALACAMGPLGGEEEEPTPCSILMATKEAIQSEDAATQRVDVETLSSVSQEALTERLKLKPGPFSWESNFRLWILPWRHFISVFFGLVENTETWSSQKTLHFKDWIVGGRPYPNVQVWQIRLWARKDSFPPTVNTLSMRAPRTLPSPCSHPCPVERRNGKLMTSNEALA